MTAACSSTVLQLCILSREPAMNDSACFSTFNPHLTAGFPSLSSSPLTCSPLATLDATVLQALFTLAGDTPFLVEVIHCYLDDAPRHLQAIEAAIGHKDRAALRLATYSFKSSSAMIGAIALGSLCARLEVMSQSTRMAPSELLNLLTDLKAEYERVKAALAQEVNAVLNEDCSQSKSHPPHLGRR